MGLFDGTELERPVLCEVCGGDVKLCDCEPVEVVEDEPEIAPEKQRLRIRVEKRKRGKMMTVVSGFRGSKHHRQELLTQLKNHCGAGGTLEEDNIEIQGDHNSRVQNFLKQLGFRV